MKKILMILFLILIFNCSLYDISIFANEYNFNRTDTIIDDGTIEQLEHAFKYKYYNEIQKYLDYYANKNKPISEKDLELKTPIEQEAYKVFITFHNTRFLYDTINSYIEEYSYKYNIKYNKYNYLIIQPEILVRITDYVKYKSSNSYRSKIINKDTLYDKILSSMILMNFYPDLQIDNKKIIYSDYRMNQDILTFLRNPSYNNYPVLDKLAKRKFKFIENVVPLNIYPTRLIQLNSPPFISHIEFNKELTRATVYFIVEHWSTIYSAVFNKIDGKWQFIKPIYMDHVN